MAAPFTILTDNFTRADSASPGNYWADAESGYPTAAAIASNALSIPNGAALASRQRVLIRPIHEACSTQKIRVTFTYVAATQFASFWIKINTTLHKGIRLNYQSAAGGITFSKVTAMDTGSPATANKGTTGAVTPTGSTVYIMEVSNAGAAYSAQLYASDGVTAVGSPASWTDGEGDSADYTAAWPCGFGCQEATTFDDFVSTNNASVSFQASIPITNYAAMSILIDRTAGQTGRYAITRNGGHTASVTATVATLPTGVTATDADPTTGSFGTWNIVGGSTAVANASFVEYEIRCTDGTDNFVLRPTLNIYATARGADLANLIVAFTSTPQKATTVGDLETVLATLHGGTNSKTTTKITDLSYNQAVGGTGYDYWRPGTGTASPSSSVTALLVALFNYGFANQAFDIFGTPFSSNDNLAFASFSTFVDATLTAIVDNGMNLNLIPMQPRFDSDTELTASTLSSVSGTEIGVTSYTFAAGDVGRWLGVLHTAPSRGMYRQITAVNTGTNTCTIESAFTVFPASNGMTCKIWSGTRATLIAAHNTEWAKRAYDSGDAAAKFNNTYGSKVRWYATINGVNMLTALKDYLNWADEIHVDTDAQTAGHIVVAGFFRDLVALNRLTAPPSTFTLSPDGTTITDGATQQYTPSAPTEFDDWGWTVGYPGNMIPFAYDVTAGLGSIDSGGVYTSAGATSATVRARLSYALSVADTSSLTVTGAASPEPSTATTSNTGCQRRSQRYADKYPRRPNIRASRGCKDFTY